MNVKNTIIDISKLLDSLDDHKNKLPNDLSDVDSKICDLMHLIEYNKLKTNQCYRIVQELHKLRVERRNIKNDMELTKVFYEQQNKLLNNGYRQLLLSDIGKKEKSLINSKYNNRKYTEEEINELIGV